MRIVVVISSLRAGGAERTVAILAQGWVERGNEVTLITFADTATDFYSLGTGVARRTLDWKTNVTSRLGKIFGLTSLLRKIRSAVWDSRPDVVVSFIDHTNILCLLALRGLRLPTLVCERIDPSRYRLDHWWEWLRRKTYPWAARVVVQTERVRTWCQQEIPGSNLVVVPNSVQLLEPINQFEERSLNVICLGRLEPQKRFDRALHVFSQAVRRDSERFRQWKLEFLGDGSLFDELRQSAVELGIADRVVFHGRVTNPGHHLQRGSIFLLTSDFEGFPNALLEAMACGMAAISMDCCSGPREVIRHNEDGILVPDGDLTAMENSLAELMDDPGRRRRLGERAKEVCQRFSVDSVLETWEGILQKSLEHQCGTRT